MVSSSGILLSTLIAMLLAVLGMLSSCPVSGFTVYIGVHSTSKGTTVEPTKNLKVAVRILFNEFGSILKITSSPLFPDVIDGCAQSYVPANLQSPELVTVTGISSPKPFTFISFVDSERVTFVSFTGSSLSEQPHKSRVADSIIDILFNSFIFAYLI